ncbi:hypothetical protein D6D21_03275 [Aureobasidium pullulans]|uniref:Uncharacterized protein n=1 Tax=Aureobasidium pullulans TaxID=5580 RepID=A0AB74J387_AURPU|nr:hypothetical protein D6D21_03275 [Aureobasidium pullulans]THX57778.1 hypothetical protein D6D11_03072 [Aureobasidium pullulans]
MTCRISRFTTYQEDDSYDHARRQQRPISIVILLSTYFSTTTITKKMPPSTKHLLEKFLSLFSCSRLGDDEDDDNEATSRPLVIGGPVDFRHHETEGGGPLRAPVSCAPEPFVR